MRTGTKVQLGTETFYTLPIGKRLFTKTVVDTAIKCFGSYDFDDRDPEVYTDWKSRLTTDELDEFHQAMSTLERLKELSLNRKEEQKERAIMKQIEKLSQQIAELEGGYNV